MYAPTIYDIYDLHVGANMSVRPCQIISQGQTHFNEGRHILIRADT